MVRTQVQLARTHGVVCVCWWGRFCPDTRCRSYNSTLLLNAVAVIVLIFLCGIAVVVEVGTGVHYVVDVNYFPGYNGFPNFHQVLLRYAPRPPHTPEPLFAPLKN